MAITNLANTSSSRYWVNGGVFPSPYGDPTTGIVYNTENNHYFKDGGAYLYPFQNTNASTLKLITQLMLVTMSVIN